MTDNKQEEWVDNRSLYPTMTILELYDYFWATLSTSAAVILSEMIVQGEFCLRLGAGCQAQAAAAADLPGRCPALAGRTDRLRHTENPGRESPMISSEDLAWVQVRLR